MLCHIATGGTGCQQAQDRAFDAVIMLGALCIITSDCGDHIISIDRRAFTKAAITDWCCTLTCFLSRGLLVSLLPTT